MIRRNMISAAAHFQTLIPSTDVVEAKDAKTVSLGATFTHPFERHMMNMEKPARFGVVVGGKTTDLLGTLKEKKVGKFSTWTTLSFELMHSVFDDAISDDDATTFTAQVAVEF